MLSLAAHARAAVKATSMLSTSTRRPIITRGNDPKLFHQHDKVERPTFIDNAPGWNEDLATTSEASVKADRDTTTLDSDEMQQKTVDYVQSHYYHHHHRPTTNANANANANGTDPPADPEVERTHANYAREEIGGPLGNAGMGEFEGVVGNDDLGPDHEQVESNGRIVTRRVVGEPGSGAGQANV